MNKLQRSSIALSLTTFAALSARAAESNAPNCEALAKLALAKATITLAQVVEAGQLKGITGMSAALATQLPRFCRVAATLKPSADSDIKIEVWLPAENWNGRFQGVGNGGLAGSISYAAMAEALRSGYATASTDTGHTGTFSTAQWGMGHPEKVIDFGHRAVHEMTVAAKAVTKAYYGNAQHHAYWNGCSEGGNQALGSAQRYPNDYDGILAGAPANYMTRLQMNGAWIQHAIQKDPATFISPKKLPALNKAVLEACDTIDGVADGIVAEPRACAFDMAQLKCSGEETDSCLTAPQINGIQKIYGGAKNAHSGETIFPGHAAGSELEWNGWIVSPPGPNGEPTNRQFAIANEFFKYLAFGKTDWDWKTFDFDADVEKVDKALGGIVNQINPDLSAFKKRGGKLLQYHGWYDPAITPLNSINYFESVQKRMGDTKDFYRLFMVPGMSHCAGGPGASSFDKMDVIVKWVEEKKTPDMIVATKAGDGVVRSRPLCPHPQVGRHKDNDQASFSCVTR